ncbi:MAG: response regulator [Desulfobacterales bacterium]|nr:response regulator [Desulfobacterales bacterium]
MTSINILFVDNNKPFIETIAQRLRERGFTVDCVFSGMTALNRLEETNTIDIVFLDLQLPDLDGIQTLSILKKKHPLVEVVILTGHPTVNSVVEAFKCGAFDYLTKPSKLNDLISKATQAAARKKEREDKILNVRMTPYLSTRERNKLISDILGT